MALQAPAQGLGDGLRLVLEAVPSAMIMADRTGQIVLVNAEAERAFGYTRDELLRMRVEELVPARSREAHHGFRERYFDAPSRRGMGVGRELFGVRRDGSELPIEIGLNPIVINGQHFVLASIIDISERLAGQAAAAVAREDELRRSILDTIPMMILATDPSGRILSANPAAEELLGRSHDELIGLLVTDLGVQARPVGEDGSPLREDRDEVERAYRHPDGSTVHVGEQIVALRTEGEITGYLVTAFEISKRLEARQRIEHMVTHDPLTDLPNRTALMAQLDELIKQAEREGNEVTLLLLDLDHFKRINDSLGHDIGDELIVQVSDRLRSWVRDGDLVARLGGDEFVVVFGGVLPCVDLTPRIEELLASLLAPVHVQGYELVVTASAGGASYPTDGDNPITLLRHVDTAMYRAKASGRDGISWFDTAMVEETNDKLALSGALRQALGQGELSVVYQPQFDLGQETVEGFEALARWWSPELGAVTPDRFIPVAEDNGMIGQLGEWVLRQACADLAILQESLGRKLRLAVNVSPRQLRGDALLGQVASALADAGLEPWQLGLEITEGILIDHHSDAIELLAALRDLGVQIVLDDFGCGYSSLAYLARFPIDKLKIDRSFVRSITSPDDEAAIVDAIIVMAHALGMRVVAEGVETAVQEDYLRARGCDETQGYLYGAGVPVAEAVAHLDIVRS